MPCPFIVLRSASTDAKDVQTLVWRVPVGLRQLVISGAFDAWRYRDTTQSTFDATWRDIIDDAASQRLGATDVRLSSLLVTPRATVVMTIVPRDSANGAPIRAPLASRDLRIDGPG
ncbi:MAG: hypothetical protein IPP90_06070 [Gemmatimonadaceae bacterium]|nr:hypothetical protein [Gemmatimonadaceae bacterium]